MTSPRRVQLFGFVNPRERRPAFLIPVFGSSTDLWIQDGKDDGLVWQFSPCSVPSEKIILEDGRNLWVGVGDPFIYAFQFFEGPVEIGTKPVIERLLAARLSEFSDLPFLLMDVLKFIKQPEALLEAIDRAKEKLALHNPQIAEQWTLLMKTTNRTKPSVLERSKASVAGSGQAALVASMVAADSALRRIEEVQHDPNLPVRHKRRLVKTEVAALIAARKTEIEDRLKIQQMRLAATAEAAERAIDIYRNQVIYEMGDEFYEFMGRLGVVLSLKDLGLLKELDERLTEFRRSLTGKKIKKEFVQAILEQVDEAFAAVREQLGKRAADLIVSEKRKDD